VLEVAQEAAPELAGVAVTPGTSFRILFTAPRPDARMRVTPVDAGEIRVRAPAGAASFTSDGNRLLVSDVQGGTTVEVEIPRRALSVVIEVAGSPVFHQEKGRVAVKTSVAGPPYLIPLLPNPPSP
jgi:hypothetical protein